MEKVRIKQLKSLIGYPNKQQKRTMQALGFGRQGKLCKCVEHTVTPAIQGMINRVRHLVTIEKL